LNSNPTSVRGGSAGSVFRRTEGKDRAPAVIVLPAIAGLNGYMTNVCDGLAGQGFASVLVDYHARTGKPDLSDRAKVMAAVASLPDRDILADIGANIEFLQARPDIDPKRIAVLGFCIGGSYAILAASEFNQFRCAIAFYGTIKYPATNDLKPLSPFDAAQNLKCPFLGHFGEDDALIPPHDVAELKTRLKHKPAEVYTYPGAGHAFHEDFRSEVYRPIAAKEAWGRSVEYLQWYCAEQASQAAR
jgi:dienelactone hydrolase